MTLKSHIAAMIGLALATAAGAAPTSLDGMRWQRRVVLVSTRDPRDPQLALQRRILADWHADAVDRDVWLVAISGTQVTGASDGAAALRKRFGLNDTAFQALLIGKDGQIALRSARPIDADTLRGVIDAMPMRRAGER